MTIRRMLRNVLPTVLMLPLLLAGCQSEPRATDDANLPYSGYAASEEAFTKGMNRAPTARTLYAMSRILLAQGKDGEAMHVLRRVLKQDPKFLPAYCDMAEVHLRQNQVDRSMEVLTQGLRIAPDDPVLLNNLGLCHLMKDELQSALDCMTEAAALAPDNARYAANRAVVLGLMGRYEDALGAYEAAIPPGEAQYNLAVLYEAGKQPALANQAYRRAEELGVKKQPVAEPAGAAAAER